jgi:hypothetical protein
MHFAWNTTQNQIANQAAVAGCEGHAIYCPRSFGEQAMTDAKQIAARLSKAQKREIKLVRDDDCGYLARGDQSGLSKVGLAVPPRNCMGYYRLTLLGLAVRKELERS